MTLFKQYLEALGSRKRDYRQSDDGASANLCVHKERMDELIALGKSEEEASKIAYDEIMDGKHEKKIKKHIQERVAKRNRKFGE